MNVALLATPAVCPVAALVVLPCPSRSTGSGTAWPEVSMPRAEIARYASVTDPRTIAFAPDGTLYVGRDNTGSGGGAGDSVKIHRVGLGGLSVVELGGVAIADPDGVAYDATGTVSGRAGSVIVGICGNFPALRRMARSRSSTPTASFGCWWTPRKPTAISN